MSMGTLYTQCNSPVDVVMLRVEILEQPVFGSHSSSLSARTAGTAGTAVTASYDASCTVLFALLISMYTYLCVG